MRNSLLLILSICSVYVPFLNQRLIRMTGDEKVYVSQAIEMERFGTWFLQRLHEVPDYYKGPFHYGMVRLGFLVFGKSPWAALYMNLVLVLLGSLALADIARRRLKDWKGGDLFVGLAFALSVGVYSYTWVSQMEVELASICALCLYALDRLGRANAGFGFWSLVGISAWIKSPLHALFFGVSGLLFWTLSGELIVRIKNFRTWIAIAVGLVIGCVGYAPALIFDRENFWNLFIVREHLSKVGGSGQSYWVALQSVFGFYHLPWMFLAGISYLQLPFALPKLWRDENHRRVFLLGVCGFIPSVLFFLRHPYVLENYNLPVISGILLMNSSLIAWGVQSPLWRRLYCWATRFTGLTFLGAAGLVGVVYFRISNWPSWWPTWSIALFMVGSLFSLYALFKGRIERPQLLAFSFVPYLWGLTAILSVLGEREMRDLRGYLDREAQSGHVVSLTYVNLNRNIWSEWGWLNLWLNRDVKAASTPEALKAAIQSRNTLLIQNREGQLEAFQAFMQGEFPELHFKQTPWTRWRTRGQSPSGAPLWKDAWDRRSFEPIETPYWIIHY